MDKMFSNLRIATCKLAMSIILLGLTLTFATSVYAATYYIDYVNGNDSNTTNNSKSTPWKRHPYMNGFTGTYNHQAGDRFIFKGGVSWPNACFPLNPLYGGSSSAKDYYGVSSDWYSGGTFSRPKFDFSGSPSSTPRIYPNRVSYITFDNFEFYGLVIADGNLYPPVSVIFSYESAGIVISNCYAHGWSVIGTNDQNAAIFYSVSEVNNCIVDGSESLVNGEGSTRALWGIEIARNNIIHDVPNGIGCGEALDNLVYNIVPSIDSPAVNPLKYQHGNAIYSFSGGRIAGNIVHDVYPGYQVIYVEAAWDNVANTTYIYNNIVYNVGAPCIGLEYEMTDSQLDTYTYIYNNTLNGGSGCNAIRAIRVGLVPKYVYIANNHFIGDTANLVDIQNILFPTSNNNLTQTVSQANADGYTTANLYQPISGNRPTVNAGVSISSIPALDKLGVSRPQGLAWDIGAYEYNSGAPADTTPPTITAFEIPATTTSLTVPITTLTATDTVGVSGYKLTESATAPLANASGWTSNKPSSYTFTTAGSKTLYAWAKDAAGNVSTSLNDSVTITLPAVIYGDVSGDGQVTVTDSLMVARYSAGLITFTNNQKTVAEVSGNGNISSYDASLISQRAKGLISKFPIE